MATAPLVQQFLHAVHDALVEGFAVARFAVGGDGVGEIGTGDVEQRIAFFDGGAGIHQDARDGPVDLGDGLGGVVGIPIDRAGGVDGDGPRGLADHGGFEMTQLVRRERKHPGLYRSGGLGFALLFLEQVAGRLRQA